MVHLVIIYNNFGPYHLARLDATARLGKGKGYRVVGLELASREIIHQWTDDSRLNVEKYTIFAHEAIEELKAFQLFKGVWSALNTLNPAVIAIGPSRESTVALLTTLFWVRLKKRTAVILMDSKYSDSPRNPLREAIKRTIMSRFDAALVGGTYSREYAEFLGIPAERIFTGCDVIDNEYFASKADWARENAAKLRDQYGLPDNYFLYVGRFDEKKNVSRLLQAYAQYVKMVPIESVWHLVLCGSGPLEDRLRQEAREMGLSQAIFPGFKQIEDLPIFYGLARCLIIPSSHHEQWGLVVNEAMAARLPVLVSRACGCTPDLVQDGVNGFTFDPYDVKALAQLLGNMSSGAVDLSAMGEASQLIIGDWGLERFVTKLFQVVAAGQAKK
jgi:glycosyltransferase involved in cell wall biosynthesis